MEDHLVSIIANVQYFVRGVAVRTDGAIVIRGWLETALHVNLVRRCFVFDNSLLRRTKT